LVAPRSFRVTFSRRQFGLDPRHRTDTGLELAGDTPGRCRGRVSQPVAALGAQPDFLAGSQRAPADPGAPLSAEENI
jgi:hypothetical protein